MKLLWRPLALEDREVIFQYISKENAVAAILLDNAFEEKAEEARKNPNLYRIGRIKGTREIVVRPNYVMVYRVNKKNDALVILRVLHAARKRS